jgi:hypothetical protein
MFRRLILDHWQAVLAAVLFVLTFVAFVGMVLWTLRLKDDRVQRSARLPLADDERAGSPPPAV